MEEANCFSRGSVLSVKVDCNNYFVCKLV